MKNLTDWRAFGLGITLLAIAIVLPLTLIGQAYAGDWNEKEPDTKGAFIGVYPEDLNSENKEALGYKGDGILVEDVVDEGPAEKGGIESGDIITSLDKEKVTSASQFRDVLAKYSAGDKIRVGVIRDGSEKEMIVELASRPKDDFTFMYGHAGDKKGFLGVVTESIEGDFAKYFGVKEGALIKKIVEDSPAEKAGLKPGDVLTEIGDEDIEDTDDVAEAISDHKPGDMVNVKYVRQGKESSIDIKLADQKGSSSWNWMGGDRHKIIITDDDRVTIDTRELREAIREALKEGRMHLDEGREDLRRQIEQLKAELDQLKKEMEARKSEKK